MRRKRKLPEETAKVASLMAWRLSNKEIARLLGMSIWKVNNLVHAALKHFQCDNRRRLAAFLHTHPEAA